MADYMFSESEIEKNTNFGDKCESVEIGKQEEIATQYLNSTLEFYKFGQQFATLGTLDLNTIFPGSPLPVVEPNKISADTKFQFSYIAIDNGYWEHGRVLAGTGRKERRFAEIWWEGERHHVHGRTVRLFMKRTD
jgi:hypothetical protein